MKKAKRKPAKKNSVLTALFKAEEELGEQRKRVRDELSALQRAAHQLKEKSAALHIDYWLAYRKDVRLIRAEAERVLAGLLALRVRADIDAPPNEDDDDDDELCDGRGCRVGDEDEE